MKMFLILALAVLSLSLRAEAGDRIGNGGGLWACKTAEEIKSAELVDLYEARDQYPLSPLQTSETDPNRIADERLAFLSAELPAFTRDITHALAEVRAGFFLTRGELEIIDDVLPKIHPPSEDCASGSWTYVQFANFDDKEVRILVQKKLWESPVVPVLSKAALLWHEAVYRQLRLVDKDVSSVRARRIVGLVFSTLSAAELRPLVQTIYGAGPSMPPAPPAPTPPAPSRAWVCRVENGMDYKSFLGYGPNQSIAGNKAKNDCRAKSGSFAAHCREFDMMCDQPEASAQAWYCTTENGMTNINHEGYGPSQVEALDASRAACVAAGPNGIHCRPSTCQHQ